MFDNQVFVLETDVPVARSAFEIVDGNRYRAAAAAGGWWGHHWWFDFDELLCWGHVRCGHFVDKRWTSGPRARHRSTAERSAFWQLARGW